MGYKIGRQWLLIAPKFVSVVGKHRERLLSLPLSPVPPSSSLSSFLPSPLYHAGEGSPLNQVLWPKVWEQQQRHVRTAVLPWLSRCHVGTRLSRVLVAPDMDKLTGR